MDLLDRDDVVIDAVVSDISMPGAGGLDVLERARRHEHQWPSRNKLLGGASYDDAAGRELVGRRSYEILRAGIFNRLVDEERLGLIDAENWLRT